MPANDLPAGPRPDPVALRLGAQLAVIQRDMAELAGEIIERMKAPAEWSDVQVAAMGWSAAVSQIARVTRQRIIQTQEEANLYYDGDYDKAEFILTKNGTFSAIEATLTRLHKSVRDYESRLKELAEASVIDLDSQGKR